MHRRRRRNLARGLQVIDMGRRGPSATCEPTGVAALVDRETDRDGNTCGELQTAADVTVLLPRDAQRLGTGADDAEADVDSRRPGDRGQADPPAPRQHASTASSCWICCRWQMADGCASAIWDLRDPLGEGLTLRGEEPLHCAVRAAPANRSALECDDNRMTRPQLPPVRTNTRLHVWSIFGRRKASDARAREHRSTPCPVPGPAP